MNRQLSFLLGIFFGVIAEGVSVFYVHGGTESIIFAVSVGILSMIISLWLGRIDKKEKNKQ